MWKSILVASTFFVFSISGMALQQSSIAQSDSSPTASADASQQSTGGPTVEVPALNSSAGKNQKVHKWTGSLVDAGCMATALRQIPSVAQMVSPEPLAQYYLQGMENSQSTQSRQSGNQQPSAGTINPPTASHPAGGPEAARDPSGEPETSERELAMQSAQLHHAEMVKEKVRMCTPRQTATQLRPTTQYGLVTSTARLVKFDAVGNLKAMRALKTSMPAPGKPVKAKVTGVMTNGESTVMVASIEIKGQLESWLDTPDPHPTFSDADLDLGAF